MISQTVLRSIVGSLADRVAADGGRLELLEVSGGEVVVRYCQPPDCGDSCSMPPASLQRMLEAMVEAQGGRRCRVVMKEG